MKPVYIMISTILILTIILGFVIVVDIVKLYTMTNRVEHKVIDAGYSAFTAVDLNLLARRKSMDDETSREIYIDEYKAEGIIENLIIYNLKLGEDYMPTDDSFINMTSHPVKLEEIIIYNPSVLPTFTPNNTIINRTSIYIRLSYPIRLTLLGDCYKEIEVVVDTDSFYSDMQKERWHIED